MAEAELQPHTLLEDLPCHLVLDIAKTLNKDGSWFLMAKNLKNVNGDHVFRSVFILFYQNQIFIFPCIMMACSESLNNVVMVPLTSLDA